MATTNFNVQDLSGVIFKPIGSQSKSSGRNRKRPYKSAKVAPAISYDEEWVAPKASYPQVSMYERWTNDCKSAKTVPNSTEPFEQVPMFERWNW
jgi:hypothetical protein